MAQVFVKVAHVYVKRRYINRICQYFCLIFCVYLHQGIFLGYYTLDEVINCVFKGYCSAVVTIAIADTATIVTNLFVAQKFVI